MRPHKLIMEAFGPFAEKTEVNFDAMGNSIYLISGDTGAGKTTIFDGIIYALYGEASGEGRTGLNTEAFHSDYAKSGHHRNEMRIELTFSNAGRTFVIVRRMYWGKKGDSQKAIRESTLSENGNTIVTGKGREDKDDVTKKVTELLGLNADQFRRIIMLAQGEFQKFLTADSGARGAILGKLYDNRQHQDFQMRLKAAWELLKERDKNLIDQEKAQLNMFIMPGNAAEEDRGAIAADHPLLQQTMEKIIKEISSTHEKLNDSIQNLEQSCDELKRQSVQGKADNQLLDELTTKKGMLSELEQQEMQIGVLRAAVKSAEAAKSVLPYEKALQQAIDSLNKLLGKIEDLEKEKNRLIIEYSELTGECIKIEEKNSPEIKSLKEQSEKLRSALPFYEKLDDAIQLHKEKSQKADDAKREKNLVNGRLNKMKERQNELSDTLKALGSAGSAEVENAKHSLNSATQRKTDLENLQQNLLIAHSMEQDVEKLQKILFREKTKEINAEGTHHRLYTAFIKGQAGVLANDMRNKLQTNEKVVCPVCGSVHTIDDAASFALSPEEVPTKQRVDTAFSEWNKARENLKNADKNHSDKENDLRALKGKICEKAEILLAVSDWNVLTDGKTLEEAISASKILIDTAQSGYDKALSDKKAKEQALSDKAQNDIDIIADQEAVEIAEQDERETERDLASAEREMQNWKDQLKDYPENIEDAEDLIASLKTQEDNLQKQIQDAKDRQSECVRKQADNKGNLNSAISFREDREEAKNDSAEEFAEQLKKSRFEDAESYHAALSPEGKLLNQTEISVWIYEKKTRIEKYEHDCDDLRSAIKQLEASTEGKSYVDVKALEAKIGQISEQIDKDREYKGRLNTQVQTNETVLREINSIHAQRTGNEKVYAKLQPLVETADGKYAFSRYVLTGFFHRIVEQANIHLGTMTDGEYCLVPKETGDGRTNIGLDLKVLNTITDLERDTASLSGGQMFEASLSLALGLSDIVQMESTSSIQIDSMFIDEGFGSLDGARLDKAIEVLQHLSAGKRQIGIISHVARLDECLPKKIHVIAGDHGSMVETETDA